MAKHFMIYYKIGTGTFIVTEPLPWARENQHFFPNYNFQDGNVPTTDFVEAWLIANMNFVRVVNNGDVSLIQNVNPNLNL